MFKETQTIHTLQICKVIAKHPQFTDLRPLEGHYHRMAIIDTVQTRCLCHLPWLNLMHWLVQGWFLEPQLNTEVLLSNQLKKGSHNLFFRTLCPLQTSDANSIWEESLWIVEMQSTTLEDLLLSSWELETQRQQPLSLRQVKWCAPEQNQKN